MFIDGIYYLKRIYRIWYLLNYELCDKDKRGWKNF